jgi:hypothetical protein
MRPRHLAPVAALLLASTTGCITHLLPERQGEGMLVHWAPDVAAAQARATAEHKPLLLMLVAGELCGYC